ncbi:MAG: ABC transporter ATP-binding protein [bacterium]|nr:ABC transporter ATP-binding protein [bacterium]
MTELLAGRVSFEVADRAILNDVEVSLREGESVAVVGTNGAGKTTLLRLLAKVLEPSRGGLTFRGTAYSELTSRQLAGSLAYVPQVRPARVPLTVRDVVLLGRYPHSGRWSVGYEARDFEAAARALDVVGSSELADRPMSELSGGERQGVYIAAALAQETECLILDEPTTYLDPGHQRRIARLLHKLTHQEGRTLVFASHDLNLAYVLADRVVALSAGEVAAAGSTVEVLDMPLLEDLYGAPFHLSRPLGGPPAHPVVAVDLDAESAAPELGRRSK